jgi:methionyl-tRNA formyltransferase
VLDKLKETGQSPVAVVTKPADPDKIQPVTRWAEQHHIPCLSPFSPRDPGFIEAVKVLAPDLILVAGYHRIIPAEVLNIPQLGAFNLHASLLPRYRGPCPHRWVLINGETVTGLTFHQMQPSLDSGPVCSRVVVPIDEKDDAASLFLKLSARGADLVSQTLPRILAGTIFPQAQDESLATYQSYPGEEDCRIDWTRPAAEIRNRVRGLNPGPGAWTLLENRKMRIWKVSIGGRQIESTPGRILLHNGRYLATSGTDNLILERWSCDPPVVCKSNISLEKAGLDRPLRPGKRHYVSKKRPVDRRLLKLKLVHQTLPIKPLKRR